MSLVIDTTSESEFPELGTLPVRAKNPSPPAEDSKIISTLQSGLKVERPIKSNSAELNIGSVFCQYGSRCYRGNCKMPHPEHHANVECRFGDKCYNAACQFKHSKLQCRYGENCKNENCSFSHPQHHANVRCKHNHCPNGSTCPFKHHGNKPAKTPTQLTPIHATQNKFALLDSE